jgi:predicted dehydrogenase
MEPVRFGVVSTSWIGCDWVIPAMQAVPECEVVAISSREESRAQDAAQKLAIPRAYGSIDALLADENVEAVYIPTPNNCHVKESILAARKGKHVLCEKPIGLNAEEAARLIDVQRETGVEMSEAFMVRYSPRWLAARELLREGRIGEVRTIHGTYSVFNPNLDDIRFKPELGGGALGDVAIYPITAARFLFEAEPEAAFAWMERPEPDTVDYAVAGMLEFPGNRNLLFSGGLRQGWCHWIMVTGTEGALEIPISVWPQPDQETIIRVRTRDDLRDEETEIIRFPPVNQYEEQVATFAKVVRREIEQPWPIENAVAGMRVLDAVTQSAKTGERITIKAG